MSETGFCSKIPTIVLVGCSATKRAETSPARDLYTGQLFKVARAYVESFEYRWYILSALHGLINPTDIVDPYNVELNRAQALHNQRWGENVVSRLKQCNLPHQARIVFLAPQIYCLYIVQRLVAVRPDLVIEMPLKNMGIGQQKQWLHFQTASVTETGETVRRTRSSRPAKRAKKSLNEAPQTLLAGYESGFESAFWVKSNQQGERALWKRGYLNIVAEDPEDDRLKYQITHEGRVALQSLLNEEAPNVK